MSWIEDALPEGFVRKPMFGGYAYYIDERLILTIFESPGDRTYKDITCDFDIWDGCLFPADRDKHAQILALYPILVNHPVLPKWLYLPQQTEGFEDLATKIIRQIPRRIDIFGTYPKPKSKKTPNLVKLKSGRIPKPSMFGDDD